MATEADGAAAGVRGRARRTLADVEPPCVPASRVVDGGTRRTAVRVDVVEGELAGADGLAAVAAAVLDGERRRTADRPVLDGAGALDAADEAAGVWRCAARGTVRITGEPEGDCVRASVAAREDGAVRTVGARRWAGAVRTVGADWAGLVRTEPPDEPACADLTRADPVDRGDEALADGVGRAGARADRGAGAERAFGADRGAGVDRGAGAERGAGLGARRGCA